MKILLIVLLMLSSLSLTGCVIHPRDRGMIVDPDDRHDDRHGDGHFCPPGQAKKNNC